MFQKVGSLNLKIKTSAAILMASSLSIAGPHLANAADRVSIEPDLSGFVGTEGSLQVIVRGSAGGAVNEISQVLSKAGVTPKPFSGVATGETYQVPGMKLVHYTSANELFILTFDVKNASGDSNGWKSFSLRAVAEGGLNSSSTYFELSLPDDLSATLYSLMKKAGYAPSAQDISLTLQGNFIHCWGYHGYPQGNLNPTCSVTLK